MSAQCCLEKPFSQINQHGAAFPTVESRKSLDYSQSHSCVSLLSPYTRALMMRRLSSAIPSPGVSRAHLLDYLKCYSDLAVFQSSTPPYPAIPLTAASTLPQLAFLYHLTERELFVNLSVPPNSPPCACAGSDGELCGAHFNAHEYGRMDQLRAHIAQDSYSCTWKYCEYVVPQSEHDRSKQSMRTHLYTAHFLAFPTCPFCRCNLYQPPMAPPKSSQDDELIVHLASGWCIGLARLAISKGLPVPLPR